MCFSPHTVRQGDLDLLYLSSYSQWIQCQSKQIYQLQCTIHVCLGDVGGTYQHPLQMQRIV